MRVLFVCSRNQWRSPTAERVFAGREGLETRSRGVSRTARRRLSRADVAWADVILVMDRGRLVEKGTHRELLTSGDVYRRLYERQVP